MGTEPAVFREDQKKGGHGWKGALFQKEGKGGVRRTGWTKLLRGGKKEGTVDAARG